MNKITAFGLVLAMSVSASAEEANKTLASTIDVFVFPEQGQDASQQSQDEAACYEWAVGNTGSDPFELAKQKEEDQLQAQDEAQAAEQAGKGAGARGAARGAATGAVIGEIADDEAGKGAAYGAAAGALRGKRKRTEAQQESQQEAAARAEQRDEATDVQLENFKKAFSVCLEAKEYLVKY